MEIYAISVILIISCRISVSISADEMMQWYTSPDEIRDHAMIR
jgi:hypothetical protein